MTLATPPGLLVCTWANIAAAGAFTTRPNPLKNLVEEITLCPLEGNTTLRNANYLKEILNIISKFISRASLVTARKIRSRDIRVIVINKGYIIKNKESI